MSLRGRRGLFEELVVVGEPVDVYGRGLVPRAPYVDPDVRALVPTRPEDLCEKTLQNLGSQTLSFSDRCEFSLVHFFLEIVFSVSSVLF